MSWAKYISLSAPESVQICLDTLADVVAVDIETDGLDPLKANIICAGVGDKDNIVIIDPWVPHLHAPILSECFSTRSAVTHNGPNFDHIALERDGVTFGRVEDTLIAAHAFASHFPLRLDHVGSVFCDLSQWKMSHGMRGGDEKGARLPKNQLPEERDLYNAQDVRVTILSWHRMQADLAPFRKVYEEDMKLAMLCKRMIVEGIYVDKAAQTQLSLELGAEAARLRDEMRSLLSWPEYTPSRNVHVQEALYKRLRAPVLGVTPTGRPGTSESVLEQLAKHEGTDSAEFASRQMRWRLLQKVRGTYCDPIPVGEDGRAHYNIKSFGTVSGRLAGRFQSNPRYTNSPEGRPRELYCADPKSTSGKLVAQVHDAAIFEVGGELVYFDLSQAEARIAAYISGDPLLIKAVETDIHLANANVMFGHVPQARERLERGNELSPLLDSRGKPLKWKSVSRKEGGCKEERDISKNVGFCVWYCGSAERAYEYLQSKGFHNCSMRACEAFVARFHDHYWQYYKYVNRNVTLVQQQGHILTPIVGRFCFLGFFPGLPDVANRPVQATIADIMNQALIELDPKVRAAFSGDGVIALLQEYWSRLIVLPKGPLVAEERRFRIPADIKRGQRWSDFG